LKYASTDAILDANEEPDMRTTVTLDDELVKRAQALTGIEERGALLREALRELIARESARRMILLGGTEPDLKAPPRRRST
jgi:Arc/MetJ family transcription regulator